MILSYHFDVFLFDFKQNSKLTSTAHSTFLSRSDRKLGQDELPTRNTRPPPGLLQALLNRSRKCISGLSVRVCVGERESVFVEGGGVDR